MEEVLNRTAWVPRSAYGELSLSCRAFMEWQDLSFAPALSVQVGAVKCERPPRSP